MNDVGGSGSGTGLRAVKSSRTSDANFEYDDSEWDVGIGNLIIDLDADIEKNNEDERTTGNSGGSSVSSGGGGGNPVGESPPSSSSSSPREKSENKTISDKNSGNNSSLKTIGGGGEEEETLNPSPVMHIPKSPTSVTPSSNVSGGGVTTLKSGKNSLITGNSSNNSSTSIGTTTTGSTTTTTTSSTISISGKSLTLSSADLVKNSGSLTSMEHTTAVGDKGLKMKIKRSKPGTKSVDAKHEIVKSDVALLSSGSVGGKNSTNVAGIEVKSSATKEKEKVGKELVDGVPNAASANNVSKVEEREGITGSGNGGSTNSANTSGIMSDSGSKSKGTKRGSTHKKVKTGSSSGGNVGSGSGSVVVGGSGSNKSNSKDSSSIDSKAPSSISISNSSSLSTSSNSHVKELGFGGATVSLSGSAFAKTASSLTSSNNSTLKAPVSTTLTNSVSRSPDALTISSGAAATLSSGTTNTVTSTASSNAFRNAHLSTATTTSPSSGGWASGSPAKNEKAPISPSVTNQTEKLSSNSTNSPTPYGKKARVFPCNERGNTEESFSHTLTSGGGPNSSSHRTSITLSSASLNDLNTSSSSTGIMNQGGPLSSQVGSGLLTSFTPGRDTKAGKASSPVSQDVCIGTSVGTVTEPDCLGPCEPGTSVTLEGIVWHETEGGVLVVNVTWRGKTYVGTLLDCTKNDWAPPRFCDSPTSDLEMRTPKNRGKRGRAQASTPVNEPPPTDTRQVNPKLRNGVKGRRGSSSNAGFATPVSPMKSEQWPKRKTRGSENESQDDVQSSSKNSKRPKVIESSVKGITSMSSKDRQSASPAPTGSGALADGQAVGPYSPALIECPEPNCSKKYKHINGLRYHQSHAHSNNFTQEDSDSNMSTASTTNVNVGDSNGDRNSKTADNVDGILPSDSIDMDVDMVSTTDGENTSSAPTTPAKRPSVNSKEVNDKVYDINSDADLLKDDANFPTKMRVLKVPLAVPTLGRSSSGASADKDKIDGEKVLTEGPVKEMSSSIPASVPAPVSRVPILTVPMYISRPSVNHNQEHHGNTSGRELNEKSMGSNRDDSNVIKNAGNVGLSFSGSHVISKGAPWQPHAHSIPPNVISSSHAQQPVNAAVALTVPVINAKDHEKSKSSKDRSSSDSSQTKKNKHKKKSKDKDRERGRDGQKSSSSSGVNSSNAKPFTTVSVGGEKPRGLSEKRSSSLEESEKESGKGFPAEISSTGEGRDDPQSPAYSDISDANDSGAENDLTVGGGGAVKDGVKNLLVSGTSDLTVKKDAVVGLPPGHGMTPFFPSFYSPFIDPNNPPAPSSNQTLPPKLDSSRSGNLEDSPSLEGKSKVKSHSHLPPHLHSSIPPTSTTLSPDERRSPKIDYPLGSKYVPPGHYFPPQHPYYNYYDYPSGSGIMSDGSYGPGNHSRILDEKEHETQISSEGRGGHKGKSGEKSESPSLLGNIKQEPGIDKERMKDNRVPNPLASEKEPREIKTEFGDNYVADKRPVNLLANQHFMPCSKHSKDARRDRGEDRHERREESSKDGKGRSSAESAKSKLASERERDAEAEKEKEKNEGSKPTMETQGPPPPPTAGSYAYIPQSYLQGSPFGFPMDPGLYRQMLGPYPGSPYAVHPSMPRYPPNPGSTPLPEDLSRPTGQAPPGSAPKALDLLSHHAAQYYASHKIHELQERALKSPSPQVGSVPSSVGQNLSNPSTSPLGMPDRGGRGSIVGGTSGSNPPGLNSAGPLTSGKVADLTKDVKPLGLSVAGHPPESRSPPTQHHVHSHTHHHTHVGIGYPIIPTVPPQYSPHYGVIASPAPPPSVPASVITPFPPQKPT